ncbi:monooxygenase [Pseudomonas asuensis]|uniref:FAD-dependent urate hydroxylase n=1 Tax=Pseudomonas asuensis TaxID=1825787 RepID=A0ABQ2H211_9PSED|nr:FAD-dependent urate hydroxylase HpxO [Pseudomonas asuensis]GGM22106.1 monooxygenase [Pseudomonas asuensis]
MNSLDIIIIGAGIGGLTAAIALQQQGHRVRLFDRKPELTPAGSAISIWPNGVKVLNALGLGDAIAAASGDMQTMSYSDREGKLLTRFSLQPLYETVNQTARPIARTALQRILLATAGEHNVTLGISCDFAEQRDGKTIAHFSDGSQLAADLLIAADGTHSKLRDLVTGQKTERRYCGYVNWNGRIEATSDLAPLTEWAQFVGDHKRVSLMPMGGGLFYFFFDVPLPAGTPNERSHYKEELSEHFQGWAEPVRRLVERLDPATIARVEIHDIEPLTSLINNRLVLLGDSAHAMAPDLGQGGCQAMEDAWVLAQLLTQHEDLSRALKAYDEARLERVASIVTRARKRAETTHGHDPVVTQAWYRELAYETGEAVLKGIEKTVEGGPLE